MISEAIILAGGLGTRLRTTVPDLPKCMAPVAGKPFLYYLVNYLRSEGIGRFIFSLGYKSEIITEYLAENFPTLNYTISLEEEPMGTGGAIWLAATLTREKNILIANGDTLFKIKIEQLEAIHNQHHADCTLALKRMKNIDRYGVVEISADRRVTRFLEKKHYPEGLINGGIYILNAGKFLHEDLPEKFSFETDYLERFYLLRPVYGVEQNGYFIDIGIPEDYQRAAAELKRPALELNKIDRSWTLFIDRDGVINPEKKDGYILNWGEFSFYPGVLESFKLLNRHFGHIVIVSNQRGVGRNLMTGNDLETIHRNMQQEIESAGGRIDKIYYCTSTDPLHPNRKPNPGMAFCAKSELSEIDFSKSIMVGNKPSDMSFGRNAGMYTIYITTTNPEHPLPHPDIDLSFNSLEDFANAL